MKRPRTYVLMAILAMSTSACDPVTMGLAAANVIPIAIGVDTIRNPERYGG